MLSGPINHLARHRYAFFACCVCALSACGGGGSSGGGSTAPTPPPTVPPPTSTQNRAPLVAQENPHQTAVHLHPFTYDALQGGWTFSDPDGDPLTYEVKLGHSYNPYNDPNPPKGLRVEGTRVTGAPEELEAVYVTITASDKLGWTANNQFVIGVLPNSPPQAATVVSPHLLSIGEASDIDAIRDGTAFIDADGDALTYEVTLRGATAGFSVIGTRVRGAFDSVGLVEATVTARDAYNGVGTDIFLIAAPGPEPGAPTLPQGGYVYRDEALDLPARFRPYPGSSSPPTFDTSPPENLTTDAGATLGRVLFYDKRLSITNTVACASCHSQTHGFATADRFNVGALGVPLKRHAMALANVRYSPPHAWFSDMRVFSLQELVLEPFKNPEELGSPLDLVTAKLRATQFYPPLFQAAFGTPEITTERVARALAQFLQALISYRSKADLAFNPMEVGVPWDPPSVLDPQELRGLEIFEGSDGIPCVLCHDLHQQVNVWHANNGLDLVAPDPGTLNLSLQRTGARGIFRAASLRNIAVTPPYMHDGRFTTLREVIEHYDHGVVDTPDLDGILRGTNGRPAAMNLSEQDKQALEAFLKTFTDNAFLTDPKFSDPFQ